MMYWGIIAILIQIASICAFENHPSKFRAKSREGFLMEQGIQNVSKHKFLFFFSKKKKLTSFYAKNVFTL